MARPLRIHPPGGYHHVTARGNDRLPIFLDDADRWSFLRLLAAAKDRFGCEFHAYCLMTNHIHLVIEDHEGTLSKALRHIKGVHAQRFNRHHDRAGHLFEGRFWNSLLGDDAYLTTAVEYVHRNPVDAGIVSSPVSYQWSSYPAYIGVAERPTCLTLGTVLQMHGGRQELRRRTDGPVLPGGLLDDFQKEHRPPVLGTDAFCRNAIKTAETAAGTEASARRGLRCSSRPSLASIRDAVANEWNVDSETVTVSQRGRRNAPRAAALYLAHRAGWPVSEIADFVGLNSKSAESTVSSRLARKQENEPELRAKLQNIQVVLGVT